MGEWRTAPLGDLAQWYSGGTPNTSVDEYWGGDIPWISATSLKSFYIETSDRCVTAVGAVNGTRLVPTGTIIFVVRGMSLMSEFRVGITQREVAFGQDCKALIPNDGIDPYFLAYAVRARTSAVLDMVDAAGHGTGRLQTDRISGLRISIPGDLSTQRSIIAVLRSLDDKIAINRKVGYTATELTKALYERAILRGVVTESIGSIADIFDGPHATPRKTESGPWFLSISSLTDGRLILADSAHLGDIDFKRWTRRVEPRLGDVLFSYETRLGEAALMPTGVRACLGRRMALLRPRGDGVGPHTLLQAFLARSFQNTIRQQTIQGATVNRIPLARMPTWPIDLPAQGSPQLEEVLSCLDDLISNRDRENEGLDALRDALLPRLMSGDIRVQEAERIVEDAT